LRDLEFHIVGQPSQGGFIELASRLRSLFLRAVSRPWDSVHYASEWPLTLPNLEELRWWADDGVDAVALAILRRAVSLRAADVSHASALAAIAAGPVASIDSSEDAAISPPSLFGTMVRALPQCLRRRLVRPSSGCGGAAPPPGCGAFCALRRRQLHQAVRERGGAACGGWTSM
jgi:hypothetical protein